jgi:putative secretion ATPase (PEP-CTERM system associated)
MVTMYDDHYGLSGRPFALTPDPRFWFDTATHKKAMAYLGYGLSQGEGFIVITGDIGAGKTTLVGHVMATIDRDRLHVIKIVSSQIEADDLLRLVATGLEVETAGLMKAQLLVAIERGLHSVARSGRRTLLIVDEAQALHTGALEELRMLSNFQAGGHALLQIFLLGQPEFRAALHGSDRLEQLRQRIIAVHHLDPMTADEVAPYVEHRLKLVGWTGRPHFTDDAYSALFHGSGGVPRRLNQLAGRVLLLGAIEQLDTIDGSVVNAVAADINGDLPTPEPVDVVAPKVEPVAAPLPEAAVAPASKPVFVAAPEPVAYVAPAPTPTPEPQPMPMSGPANDAAPVVVAPDRFAAIEARLEEQDAALRRVLALLVDWVEGNEAAASRGGRAA